MSFLQPLILIAIAAAGIPLILHLLTLRKLPVVPFSTLSFLKELQRSRIRAVRLRQLLLLMLRTLLILLVVLAFARPALKGAITPLLGGIPQSDICLLIDDSYSMSARNENGSLLRQAQGAAQAVLDGLTENDHVSVVPFSAARNMPGTEMGRWISPALASDRVSSIQVSPVHISLEQALRAVAASMSARTSPHREVFVISDLQRGLLVESPDTDPAFDEDVAITFVPVGEPQDENLSFVSADLSSSIVEVGVPAAFDVRVRNQRADAPRSASISLFLETRRLDQRVQVVGEAQEADIRLQCTPQRTGFQTGSIVLDGDDTDYDNTWWYALHIPEVRRVLLVGEQQDAFYTSLALSTTRTDGGTGYRVTRVSAPRLTAAMIQSNDVFVVPDIAYRADILRSFREQVELGKGLIILPSSLQDSHAGGQSITSDLGIARPGSRTSVAAESFLTFGRTDLDHPLFEGMFAERPAERQPTAASLESPEVFTFVPYKRLSGTTTILSLSNRQPFLSESRLGAGHVLMYSVAFTPEWSTFPVSGLFVPLVHRSIAYISGAQAIRPSFKPGAEISLPLPVTVGMELRLRSPDGSQIPVQPTLLATGPVFRSQDVLFPGVYSLISLDGEIDRFAINVSPLESDPHQLTDEGLRDLARAVGVADERTAVMTLSDDIAQQVYASRIGMELWPMLLVLALIVAIAESILAGRFQAGLEEEHT